MMIPSQASSLYATIVVITRNRAEILGDCIRSILAQDFPKDQYELVIIDDGSTDRTPTVVSSIQSQTVLPVLRYISQSHKGVNAARNAGISNAGGEIILFIDDDELPPPNHLKQIRNWFLKEPHLAGVGGPVKDYGGSRLPTCTRCSLADVEILGEGQRIVTRLLGGNMALKADTFHKIGIFDEQISGRGDEVEWFSRASKLKFLYDPDLWVWHRRDNFNFVMICRHSFVQGLSIPLAKQKRGLSYYPNPIRIIKPLVHGLRHGCTKGIVQAFREIGAVIGFLRLIVINNPLYRWLRV